MLKQAYFLFCDLIMKVATHPRILFCLFAVTLVISLSSGVSAQILSVHDQKHFTDSLREEFDHSSFFGLYKDNYFTVGTTLGHKPTKTNSDVKFQVSIAQRLTKTTLPWNTFLFLMYTQKTLWNVFEKSMPMRDMNFNPGIGLSKIFWGKGRYLGKLTLLLEHESNGRDSIQSRSWNKISLCGSTIIDDWLMVHAKIWIPIVDGEHNRDILKYSGIFQHGVVITTPDKKFGWALTLVKRKGWNFNYNTILEFNWRVHKQSNQYFFVQYYNGYGECLLDYNKFHSRLRVGLVIKPNFFSEF